MLYLEDILEVIENVPQEMRDRTTELRELDLSIQNAHDQLEDQIKSFFSNAKKMKPQEREAIYQKIRKEYYKLLDDADEKVSVATNMHDSLERYSRKLDQELEKFKYELEADSPGITELLEKRSLELDEPIKENQKENRYRNHGSSRASGGSDWRVPVKKEEDGEPSISASPPQSSLSFNLAHIGTGNSAMAAAASQNMGSTPIAQGRRSSSLKTSSDSLSSGVHLSQFALTNDMSGTTQSLLGVSSLAPDSPGLPSSLSLNSPSLGSSGSSIASNLAGTSSSGVVKNSSTGANSSNKRQKKKHQNASSSASSAVATGVATAEATALLPTVADEVLTDQGSLESPDWTYDPNEPRYCVCNQVSYGDMVACDNPRCPVEWFHYPCVGITAPPKGKWYCPQCSSSMNRRQRK